MLSACQNSLSQLEFSRFRVNRRFLALAGSKTDWEIVYHASVVALNNTMRACEIQGLQVGDVNLFDRTLTVKGQVSCRRCLNESSSCVEN